MKLALITAIREDQSHPSDSLFKRIATNLAPMYLAGYLEKQGLPVEVQIKDRLEDFQDFSPDWVGISSVSENIEFAKEMASRAKEWWNATTLLGGVHITALPHYVPEGFDIGVVGEGEETLTELVRLFLDNRQLQAEDLASIRGISFREGEQIRFTGFRKGLEPLDTIPHPARHKYVKRLGMTYMMTSRGCPYTCSFCTIPFTSEGYRMNSPEYVLDEIKSIRMHYPQVNNIRIFDDLYIVNPKRVAKIADLVHAEGLHQELAFGCWGRANLIDAKAIESFKKMNMAHVAFGAESGSSRVLSHIKPGCTVEQNQRSIELLYDNGIQPVVSLILGHPLETEDDLWATYEFVERNLDKLHDVEFNVATPWPGTELWQGALKRGRVHPEMDFNVLRETGFFPNYITDEFPYLNQRIAPERFDQILAEFKKLFWKISNKNIALFACRPVFEEGEGAQLR